MMNNKVLAVVDALQPNMQDYMDNAKYAYWVDYAHYLDKVGAAVHEDKDVVAMLNEAMKGLSLHPQHHAATDVALTLEGLFNSEFGGKFIYE